MLNRGIAVSVSGQDHSQVLAGHRVRWVASHGGAPLPPGTCRFPRAGQHCAKAEASVGKVRLRAYGFPQPRTWPIRLTSGHEEYLACWAVSQWLGAMSSILPRAEPAFKRGTELPERGIVAAVQGHAIGDFAEDSGGPPYPGGTRSS